MCRQGVLVGKSRPSPNACLIRVQLFGPWKRMHILRIRPHWLGVKGLDMLRPKIAAILPHVSFGNILAIVSCASRLHPRPRVRRLDLGLRVEEILECLVGVLPGVDSRVTFGAAKYTRDAAYGTTRARPRHRSGNLGPWGAEGERWWPPPTNSFRAVIRRGSAGGAVTRGCARPLDALVSEPGESRSSIRLLVLGVGV